MAEINMERAFTKALLDANTTGQEVDPVIAAAIEENRIEGDVLGLTPRPDGLFGIMPDKAVFENPEAAELLQRLGDTGYHIVGLE